MAVNTIIIVTAIFFLSRKSFTALFFLAHLLLWNYEEKNSFLQVAARIYRSPVQPDFKMAVRTGAVPGTAYLSYRLTAVNISALSY